MNRKLKMLAKILSNCRLYWIVRDKQGEGEPIPIQFPLPSAFNLACIITYVVKNNAIIEENKESEVYKTIMKLVECVEVLLHQGFLRLE